MHGNIECAKCNIPLEKQGNHFLFGKQLSGGAFEMP